MELRDAVRQRRMVRRFDPTATVDPDAVRDLVGLAVQAPSAGFTQGWDFVALHDAQDRGVFWDATRQPGPAGAGWAPDDWWTGVSAAPVLILCLSDPGAYLDRYAQPDKGWEDRSPERWPVPYWDTDTAMAAMILLLGAQDLGLGALFFGVPGPRHDAVRERLGIPAGRRIVGVVALGHEAERVSGSARTRRRRGVDEVLHVGRFGASGRSPSSGA